MPKTCKETNELRIPVDPEKFEQLLELANKPIRQLSTELGRCVYYLTGIKNRCRKNPVREYGVTSANSLTKLEYQYLKNKYDFEFKLEMPVEEEKPDHGRYPMENLSKKDLPENQKDTYIAVYFGVLDALKDFHREYICKDAPEAKG